MYLCDINRSEMRKLHVKTQGNRQIHSKYMWEIKKLVQPNDTKIKICKRHILLVTPLFNMENILESVK